MNKEAPLTEEPGLYFVLPRETVLIELSRLTPTRPPRSQPGSVARAEQRMRAAAAGKLEKRLPIIVRHTIRGLYEIVDGNATYGVAVKFGWTRIPAVIENHGLAEDA